MNKISPMVNYTKKANRSNVIERSSYIGGSSAVEDQPLNLVLREIAQENVQNKEAEVNSTQLDSLLDENVFLEEFYAQSRNVEDGSQVVAVNYSGSQNWQLQTQPNVGTATVANVINQTVEQLCSNQNPSISTGTLSTLQNTVATDEFIGNFTLGFDPYDFEPELSDFNFGLPPPNDERDS